jgi:hypothetical protein
MEQPFTASFMYTPAALSKFWGEKRILIGPKIAHRSFYEKVIKLTLARCKIRKLAKRPTACSAAKLHCSYLIKYIPWIICHGGRGTNLSIQSYGWKASYSYKTKDSDDHACNAFVRDVRHWSTSCPSEVSFFLTIISTKSRLPLNWIGTWSAIKILLYDRLDMLTVLCF